MNREEKERRERLQRMLARDQGAAPPDERLAQGARAAADRPDRDFSPPPGQPAAPPAGDAGTDEPEDGGNTRRVDFTPRSRDRRGRPQSPILRRRRRRRRMLLAGAVLALCLMLAWGSGALGAAAAMAGDLADSVLLSFEPGSYPASTGISDPIQIQELAGGFVELDSTDVAVFGANGAKLRTIQPSYARPAIAVGNTRFALYNRAGTELRIESRTGTLYTTRTDAGILLCAMSPNGTTAVVTEHNRYAAAVQVLDPGFSVIYQWYATQSDGTPVALGFASDNRRFAAGCISAVDGQVSSRIFLMDCGADDPVALYEADAGSLILHLYWLDSQHVLAVLSDYAVLLDASTGAETARYDYGGASLVDVDTDGSGVALLLTGGGDASLILLDNSLAPLAQADAGAAESLCATRTALYLTAGSLVQCLDYNGALQWEKTLDAPPLAILDASQPLVFTGTEVSVLTQ